MSETVTLRQGITDLLLYKANNNTSDISGDINLNNLTTEGKYYIQDDSSVYNLPYYDASGPFFIEVFNNEATPTKTLCQRITSVTDGYMNVRFSIDNGATWGAWKYVNGLRPDTVDSDTISIYVDLTHGNDNNDGFYAETAIKSLRELRRRLAIAKGQVSIFLGPGSYGNLTLTDRLTIESYYISSIDYEQTQPKINVLNCLSSLVWIDNLDIDCLSVRKASTVTMQTACTLGISHIQEASRLVIENGVIIKSLSRSKLYSYGWTENSPISAVFVGENASELSFNGTMTINGYTSGLWYILYAHSGSIALGSNFAFDLLASSISFKGVFNFNHLPTVVPDVSSTEGSARLETLRGSALGLDPKASIGAFKSGHSLYNISRLDSQDRLILKTLEVEKGTPPDAATASAPLMFSDSTNDGSAVHSFAAIQSSVTTNTATSLNFLAYTNVEGSTANTAMRLYSNGNLQTPTIYPISSNTQTLGSGVRLWKEFFCANATINTSDIRLKSNADLVPDEVLDAWADVRLKVFQMNEALEEKGLQARWHSGVIAQEVQKAFTDHGVDPTRYAFFCHDTWEASDEDEINIIEPEEHDEYGTVTKEAVTEVIHHHQDAGDCYSIRYSELLIIEAAYLRRENERLKTRVASLESEVAELKTLVQSLINK